MQHDLIIVGGGLVGAAVALALSDTPLNIALIDAKLPEKNDSRLFALNDNSCQFLKNMGVWQTLSQHVSPIAEVHVSHQKHFGGVKLLAKHVNLQNLGHVIPAFQLEIALQDALSKLASLTLYRPAQLKNILQSELATLVLATEKGEVTLRTPLVIGADGTASVVRESTNITTTKLDYQQSALVARIQLKRSHNHIAYERFYAKGTIAMLPLLNHESALIITSPHDVIEEWLSLSNDEFLISLQREFGYRLGKFCGVGPRSTYPLHNIQAQKATEKNVILLGNALHTLHPVAAQGLNLALYEVAIVTEAIMQYQHDIAAIDLQKISDQMKKQQRLSMDFSHRLTTLFAKDRPLSNLFLSCCMLSLDTMTPIKKSLMAKLMGRAGSVPRLLLG
ncbi:MAG: hypothetical protein A3F12_07005 [Gammaproteobacteria bacterium RIFCSPHIGHO2_12_FULL_38_14]|nr:MAG: hypothetical protein A3F12_07005 [Gammaproteobacteria bacterium RIFCSPHIGHO2_12_FULL_38_14]